MAKQILQSSEVDSKHLRKMLEEISGQLSITYLKKRAISNSHKQSVKEELQDAISYISDKEHELQILLDIAKHLLDCNEDLQIQMVKQKNTENLLFSENKQLVNEIRNYQIILQEKDEKYENATDILVNTENQLMRLSVEKERHKNVRNESIDSFLGSDSGDKSFNDLQIWYQIELEKQQSNLYLESFLDIERKYSKALGDKEKMEKNLNSCKDQYDLLCSKHKKTLDKLKELQKTQKIVLDTNEKLQKKLNQAKNNNEKLMERVERLEEDVKIAENSQKTKASDTLQGSSSLLSELQLLQSPEDSMKMMTEESEDDFFNPRVQERRFSYTPNAKFTNFVFGLVITHCNSIFIPSKLGNARKDPDEEYFILATLAVKTNSQYMDTICVVPHSILYERVKKEGVPFSMWHVWIEKQLNFEYIKTLYRKKNKMQRFRNFLSKF